MGIFRNLYELFLSWLLNCIKGKTEKIKGKRRTKKKNRTQPHRPAQNPLCSPPSQPGTPSPFSFSLPDAGARTPPVSALTPPSPSPCPGAHRTVARDRRPAINANWSPGLLPLTAPLLAYKISSIFSPSSPARTPSGCIVWRSGARRSSPRPSPLPCISLPLFSLSEKLSTQGT
jgi:hypothetical protein